MTVPLDILLFSDGLDPILGGLGSIFLELAKADYILELSVPTGVEPPYVIGFFNPVFAPEQQVRVAEPGTLMLVGAGLAGLWGLGRVRRFLRTGRRLR